MLNCMATCRSVDKKLHDNILEKAEIRKNGIVNSLLGGNDMENFNFDNIESLTVSTGISSSFDSGSFLPRVFENLETTELPFGFGEHRPSAE